MLPGPDIIYLCPICNKKFFVPSLMSGNTFGATFWSDGYVEAPMLPDIPEFVVCPNCKTGVWQDNCEIIDEIELFSTNQNVYSEYLIPETKHLEAELKKDLSEIEETYLLLRLIQKENDPRRYREDNNPSQNLIKGMNRFIDLYMKKLVEEEMYLLMIDFKRELGDFESAKKMIVELDYPGHEFNSQYQHQLKWIEENNNRPMIYKLD